MNFQCQVNKCDDEFSKVKVQYIDTLNVTFNRD